VRLSTGQLRAADSGGADCAALQLVGQWLHGQLQRQAVTAGTVEVVLTASPTALVRVGAVPPSGSHAPAVTRKLPRVGGRHSSPRNLC